MASNIWLLCLEHPAILLYILSFCSFFETYFKYILIHDAFLSPKSSRQSSAHLVCALIASYALVLINIALTKSYCSSPHSKLWTPWRTVGFLFISELHCLGSGVPSGPRSCLLDERTNCEGTSWSVLCSWPGQLLRSDCVYGMNYSTQRETQQWTSILRGYLRGSVRWVDHLCPGHVDQR